MIWSILCLHPQAMPTKIHYQWRITATFNNLNNTHKHKLTQIPITSKGALTQTHMVILCLLNLLYTIKLNHHSIYRVYHSFLLLFLSMWDYNYSQELAQLFVILLHSAVRFQTNKKTFKLLSSWIELNTNKQASKEKVGVKFHLVTFGRYHTNLLEELNA